MKTALASVAHLIGVAGGALDLGGRPQVFRFGEPLQAAVQGDGAASHVAAAAEDGGQVERDVPKRIDRRRHVLARLKLRHWTYGHIQSHIHYPPIHYHCTHFSHL